MRQYLNVLLLISVFIFPCTNLLASPFDKGSTSASLSFGNGRLLSEDYFILGVGLGHYVYPGLEVGMDVNAWTGGTPSIYEIIPKITYVLDTPSEVKPFLGVFFNRAFIEDFEDSDSFGYRAGFYSLVGNRTYIGIGVVHTELQDCTESAFLSCSDTYSEITFIISL